MFCKAFTIAVNDSLIILIIIICLEYWIRRGDILYGLGNDDKKRTKGSTNDYEAQHKTYQIH